MVVLCVVTQYLFCFFFFSSRRRHTRFDCDWSSDVCSSDLSPCRSSRTTPASPPSSGSPELTRSRACGARRCSGSASPATRAPSRSEEHTSELQSQSNLVCRLLLEKKKKKNIHITHKRIHNDYHISNSHRT